MFFDRNCTLTSFLLFADVLDFSYVLEVNVISPLLFNRIAGC